MKDSEYYNVIETRKLTDDEILALLISVILLLKYNNASTFTICIWSILLTTFLAMHKNFSSLDSFLMNFN